MEWYNHFDLHADCVGVCRFIDDTNIHAHSSGIHIYNTHISNGIISNPVNRSTSYHGRTNDAYICLLVGWLDGRMVGCFVFVYCINILFICVQEIHVNIDPSIKFG